MVAVAYGGNNTEGPIDVATACNAHGGAHGRQDFESETFVAHTAPPMTSNPYGDHEARENLLVAFSCKDHGADAGDLAPTLRGMSHDGSHANAGGQVAVAFQEAQTGVREYENAGSLRANGPGHDPVGTRIREGMAVRRLTPRECERLQGFPDDYSRIPWRGKPAELCPDGPRYKALGNSMAVPCMVWLCQRIEMVDGLLRERAAA